MKQALSTFFVFLLLIGNSSAIRAAEFALIIDDMGNAKREEAAFKLPTQVAFSILPMTHLSTEFSHRAAKQKREVMLHIPMESLAGKQLGPGALTSSMSPELIRTTLLNALATVPDAIGVNNHMGSKLTQLTIPMNATMEVLQEKHLFFVDSRTTRYSKAQTIALNNGVLSLKRNVFLDHDNRPEQIDAQFQRLVRFAKKYGFAVGIAHPYPQTIDYLQHALLSVDDLDVQLVTISELMQTQHLAINQLKRHPQQENATELE